MKRVNLTQGWLGALSIKYLLIVICCATTFLEITYAISEKATNVETHCDKTDAVLKDWGSSDTWRVKLPTSNNIFSVEVTPTIKVGHWIKRTVFKDGSITLDKITQNFKESVRITQDCVISLKKIQLPSTPAESSFIDRDYALLLKIKKSFIVYSWSPSMKLSVRGLAEVKELSRELNIPVVYVLDSFSTLEQATNALLNEGLEPDPQYFVRNNSLELTMRNIQVHFPSILVVTSDNLSYAMPGYVSKEKSRDYITEALKNNQPQIARPTKKNLLNKKFPQVNGAVTILNEREIGLNDYYTSWHHSLNTTNDTIVLSSTGARPSSFVFNYNTDEYMKAPGRWDGYPGPEGYIYTEINSQIYLMSDILRSGDSASPIGVLYLGDQYPSIGLISKSDQERHYRMVKSFSSTGVTIDFRIYKDVEGKHQLETTSEEKSLKCYGDDNSKEDWLHLAMISDNAAYVSGHRGLYFMNKDGSCRKDSRFGISGGISKISFSPSNKFAAFAASFEGSYRLFIYNIESGKFFIFPTSVNTRGYSIPNFITDTRLSIVIRDKLVIYNFQVE